jgi:hypothetical protein
MMMALGILVLLTGAGCDDDTGKSDAGADLGIDMAAGIKERSCAQQLVCISACLTKDSTRCPVGGLSTCFGSALDSHTRKLFDLLGCGYGPCGKADGGANQCSAFTDTGPLCAQCESDVINNTNLCDTQKQACLTDTL